MKLKGWALLKIAVIAFPAIGIATVRAESMEEAGYMVLWIAGAACILAIFQLVLWFFYDVMTFKRGGWRMAKFSDSPLGRNPGPNFFINFEATALLIVGVVKIAAAIFQGLPALILGAGLFVVGALLFPWQALLRKLFQSRFAGRSD